MTTGLPSNAGSDARFNRGESNTGFLKQTLLLTTALFFAIAPSPDSHDIAELSANFIVPTVAAENSTFKTGNQTNPVASRL